ncbi:hypothetical protein ABZ605_27695 [Streptomyces sp. NPDC012765]|uniref:hypothetical protein n=1 Tax=Streptomyces sp. NPDC012765 TaxID=3155249 RepID=UPI0033CA300F
MDRDDLESRRRRRRTARTGTRTVPSGPPAWVHTFLIPRDACEMCARHHHHRCHGVDVLRDPVPHCPCDCGDRRDPMLLNPRAWADLAVHAPDQVWVAAMFERQRAAGLRMCAWRPDESGLHAVDPDRSRP